MTKFIENDEINLKIFEIINNYPNGASINDIEKGLANVPRRTLQRRLSELVDERKLRKQGKGRNTHYSLLQIIGGEISNRGQFVPSLEAKEVMEYVEQPISGRNPVGYNIDFLKSYIPNETYYLSSSIRDYLKKIAVLPDGKKPAGTYGKKLLDRLLIDLSWNSSRLEGNTYSLLETEKLIINGQPAKGKSDFETQMILNHKAAIKFLVESVDEIGFNKYTLCNLHAMLSDGLLPDPAASGRLRNIPVGISGTVYHPLEVPQLLDEYFQLLLRKTTEIKDPFEQAFFVLTHLAYLQPFEDVNKRVSRLSAMIPLLKTNLCPISFVDVLEKDYINGILGVYEQNRIELLRDVFVWAYERSAAKYAAIRQSLGEPDPFRVQYRTKMQELIPEIITRHLNKGKTIQYIQSFADEQISAADRARFIEMIESELLALHEGNFARYRIRLSEFKVWKEGWN